MAIDLREQTPGKSDLPIRALGNGVGSEGDRMQVRALCMTIIRSGAETCSGVVHRQLESLLSWQPVTVAR